jgi:hypothetical protein
MHSPTATDRDLEEEHAERLDGGASWGGFASLTIRTFQSPRHHQIEEFEKVSS